MLYTLLLKTGFVEALLQCVGILGISRATAKRWLKKFKEGDESFENEERGRPDSVVDNEELKRVVKVNPRQMVREIAGALEVSKSSVSRHLQQIEKTKKLD
uniref:Histone-lysine N-methyltransferase SETMAR (inferred by orthology to a human protein) n=1 Tax=Strongyloides venezuelensis TaxID=75913 RepID=A0A0K0FTB8_STRVS